MSGKEKQGGQSEPVALASTQISKATRSLSNSADSTTFQKNARPLNKDFIKLNVDASKSLGLSIIKGADGSAYPAAVKSVTKDSQADVAGVKPGMHVHAIQNQSCIDKDLQWVLSHIKSAITAKKPFEIAFLRETDNLGAFEHMIFEVQSSKPLGLSIVKAEEKSPYPATIKRVTQGQQGDSGGVKAGMHIHAIDGVDCIGKSLDDVLVMIKAKSNPQKDSR